MGAITATPPRPGTQNMCTARVVGRREGCPHPRVESADSSLCARHLLIAANDVKQIGAPYLVTIVRREGA